MSQATETKPAPAIGPAFDPRLLVDVSDMAHLHQGDLKPSKVYVDSDNGWCVQVYDNATPGCDETPWRGTLRVAVNHTRAKTLDDYFKREFGVPITWDELQAIKDHFWAGRIAIEIYPPRDKIVDVANMRWLWVLPAGAMLPFNLQAGSIHRLESR